MRGLFFVRPRPRRVNERLLRFRVPADRVLERLDDTHVVVRASRGTVTGRGQRRPGEFQGRAVRKREAGIRTESVDGAVAEISIADVQQIRDLLLRCVVCDQPLVDLLPLLQGHRVRR